MNNLTTNNTDKTPIVTTRRALLIVHSQSNSRTCSIIPMQHGLASACYVRRTKLAVLVCVALTVLHDKPFKNIKRLEDPLMHQHDEVILVLFAGGFSVLVRSCPAGNMMRYGMV